MTGAAPEELVQLRSHQLPAGTDYLWDWFLRLSSTRAAGFSGAPAIAEHEIHAFFINRHITPTQWELDLLIRMDKTLRDAGDDKTKPEDDEDVEG